MTGQPPIIARIFLRTCDYRSLSGERRQNGTANAPGRSARRESLTISPAQAAQTWQFGYVGFKGQDGSALTLLSQSDTATVLSMNSMQHATTLFEVSALNFKRVERLVQESHDVSATDGYRVKAVTVSMTCRA